MIKIYVPKSAASDKEPLKTPPASASTVIASNKRRVAPPPPLVVNTKPMFLVKKDALVKRKNVLTPSASKHPSFRTSQPETSLGAKLLLEIKNRQTASDVQVESSTSVEPILATQSVDELNSGTDKPVQQVHQEPIDQKRMCTFRTLQSSIFPPLIWTFYIF